MFLGCKWRDEGESRMEGGIERDREGEGGRGMGGSQLAKGEVVFFVDAAAIINHLNHLQAKLPKADVCCSPATKERESE